jgi:hypothetical protein
MRGSPLLRAAVVFIVLLALAPLVWRITRSDAALRPPSVATEKPAATGAVTVRFVFTRPAKKAALFHLGKEIWSKVQPAAAEEASVALQWPAEGVELRALVEWDGDAPAAMRVLLTDPQGNEHDRSVWGKGDADEVLVFP